MDPITRALFMCAANCQGNHSEAGQAAADALGVPFPIRMDHLCKAIKRKGEEPADFYPWLSSLQTEKIMQEVAEVHEAPPGYNYNEAHAWLAGYERGYRDARQLWPKPIIDRPPTEADGDKEGLVQALDFGAWFSIKWYGVGNEQPWLHTPRWTPRPPTLQKYAHDLLVGLLDDPNYALLAEIREAMSSAVLALEQAEG